MTKEEAIARARAAAKEYGLRPELLIALLEKESNFRPNVSSPKGAQGIAQFMPNTAKELGIDPMDPAQAIAGAARYLKQQIDRFGSEALGLAAYNAGQGNVRKFGGIPPFPETEDYVTTILRNSGGVMDEGVPEAPEFQSSNRSVVGLPRREPGDFEGSGYDTNFNSMMKRQDRRRSQADREEKLFQSAAENTPRLTEMAFRNQVESEGTRRTSGPFTEGQGPHISTRTSRPVSVTDVGRLEPPRPPFPSALRLRPELTTPQPGPDAIAALLEALNPELATLYRVPSNAEKFFNPGVKR